MVFVLASFFVFNRKIQIVHFIPLSAGLWGIVQFIDCYKRDKRDSLKASEKRLQIKKKYVILK